MSGELLGTALHKLVQELIAERRRIVLLERENRELKAKIESVEKIAASATGEALKRPITMIEPLSLSAKAGD